MLSKDRRTLSTPAQPVDPSRSTRTVMMEMLCSFTVHASHTWLMGPGTGFLIILNFNSFKFKQPHVVSDYYTGRTALASQISMSPDSPSWEDTSVLHLQTQSFPQSETILKQTRHNPDASILSPSLAAPGSGQLLTQPAGHSTRGASSPLTVVFCLRVCRTCYSQRGEDSTGSADPDD